MDQLITFLNRNYNLTDYEHSTGDVRVKDWLFMHGPNEVLLLTLFYLLLVSYGPTFMLHRNAYNPKWTMVVYNFLMVAFSFYMFVEFLTCGLLQNYSLICQPVDHSSTPLGYREARISWWYFFSKLVEFIDTIMIVALLMLLPSTYMCSEFYAGGFNVLVHTVMYLYYGLAALGPHVHPYLWWKRYLTSFQMMQFTLINIRCCVSLLSPSCGFPKWVNAVTFLYSSSFLVLFRNFYHRQYSSVKPSPALSQAASPTVTYNGDSGDICRSHSD